MSATELCEHRDGTKSPDPCGAGAVFVVSRGRGWDAQRSCRRHLAATVVALGGAERRDVTVKRLRGRI